MSGFQILRAVHVLIAVLGVGPLAALAMVASDTAPRNRTAARYLVAFSRLVQWALTFMLVTGLLLLRETGWIYLRAGWFQLSLVLLMFVGTVLGLTNRPLRKAGGDPAPEQLSRLRWMAWFSCAAVAVIVFLMVAKPA